MDSTAASTADFLQPELLQQIRTIQVRTQRLVTESLAGDYESAFKGRGMEFEEVREYMPGDDIRHIDWNVTARMQTPHVKSHREERELTVMLLVDVSRSGVFGSSQRQKRAVAAEVAALLAYTAIQSNDRVGLIVFSSTVEHYIPPKKGKAHVWRVIRDILTHRPSEGGTNINEALKFLAQIARRNVVAFLISDFFDTHDFSETLRPLARRHELTAVSIADRREQELPNIGIVELEDLETGERMVVDTHDRRTRQAFAERQNAHRLRLTNTFNRFGVGQITVWAHGSTVDPIVRYFRARER